MPNLAPPNGRQCLAHAKRLAQMFDKNQCADHCYDIAITLVHLGKTGKNTALGYRARPVFVLKHASSWRRRQAQALSWHHPCFL
jgi:hypothetical protein